MLFFPPRKGRFFTPRTILVPTFLGWTVFCALFSGFSLAFLHGIYPFLAPKDRIPADLLIVEGWLPPYAMREAAAEFSKGGYSMLVTTEFPVPPSYLMKEHGNFADWNREILMKMGVDGNKIVPITSPGVVKDRTYTMALAVGKWLSESGHRFGAANLFTLGPHARRSRLLYQKALGEDFPVGVIPADDVEYNKNRWWKSSAGFRTVTDELLAYFYARLLFHP